jgi:hypothetical protein
MLLAPNRPGSFLGTERVLTDDGKVQLAPAELVAAARGLESASCGGARAPRQLKLISKRELRSLNSWMRNNPELAGPATNYLFVHPETPRASGSPTAGPRGCDRRPTRCARRCRSPTR